MSTSGTVGTQTISVQALIDHAARRAGKLAEELSVEQVQAARNILFMLLTNLANIGIQYWCIQKSVVGFIPDQFEYTLPVGTVDVLNSNYRSLTNNNQNPFVSSGDPTIPFSGTVGPTFTQTAPNGYLGVSLSSAVYIGTVGILPSAALPTNIVIESSPDGATWTTVYAPGAVTWQPGQWLWYDLDPSATQPYWRIRETGGATLQLLQAVFGSNTTEIPLARMNRDDYVNLPNKNFTSTRPLQFWFNRTLPQPTMVCWPAPSDYFSQMTVWRHRQIQDVGQLSGNLEVPDRWLQAVKAMHSHGLSLELPGVDLARIQYLEGQADEYWNQAEQEERDKSPIFLTPNISVYTR